MKRYIPHILASIIFITMILSAIKPHQIDVFIAEIIPSALIFLIFLLTYKKFQFSNTAYILFSIWIILHTIGAHYTFAHVPFEYITNLFDFQRNHFDRVAHFSMGLFAYGIAEFVYKKGYANFYTSIFLSLATIMAIACGYEIIEWIFAIAQNNEVGLEFLGSQGDIWDAQKDMLADTLGAIIALVLFYKNYQKTS